MSRTAVNRLRVTSFTGVSCVLLAFATLSTPASGSLKSKRTAVLRASKTLIMIPCPPGMRTFYDTCPANGAQVTLTTEAEGFRNPDFAYTVGVGRIVGERNFVVWDLNGVIPGIYKATVEVRDNKKHRAVSSVTVMVQECRDCVHAHDDFCRPIAVVCYDEVKAGTPIICKVEMPGLSKFKYVWSVYGYSGEDLSGRLKSRDMYVSIPTETLAGQTLTVEVNVKGLDPSCNSTASGKTKVNP